MKVLFSALLLLTLAISSCQTKKKTRHSTESIQSLNVAKAQLLTVKKCTVLVIANQKAPEKVARYYVLQGKTTKEQSIPKSVLNESSDFVSLQAESNFWVLTLSQSDRYRNLLTKNAKTQVLKGFGLAKYQESGLDFDTFVAELKSGKHDAKFKN